jgi:hypothetical protein
MAVKLTEIHGQQVVIDPRVGVVGAEIAGAHCSSRPIR